MKPQLRFKEFTDDWEEKKLGDVGNFKKGKNLSKKDISEDGKKQCILYGELYTTYSEVINHIISATNVEDEFVIGNINDVLIPSSGESADEIAISSALNVNNVILGGDINVFQSNEDGKFIAYFLTQNARKLSKIAQGATVVHLYAKDLKQIKISLPSLPEQEKIGKFFSLLDQRIEKQERKVALLEERKKGWMQKLFNQEIRFKDKNGNDYPDWEEKKLGEVSEKIQRGSSPRPITDKKWFDEKSDIGWIRISDITRSGKYIYDVEQRLSEEGIAKSRYLEVNHLILSIAATIGKPVINKIPVCIHDGFIVFKNIYPSNDIEFLYYLLVHLKKEWLKYQQPGSQANLNSDLVRNQKIHLPSLPEQEKIGQFFSLLDQQIEKEKEKLNLMKQEKKGFMQRMFV